MDNTFLTYPEIVAVVIELADVSEEDLKALSRQGKFAGYTVLKDDDGDTAVWKMIDVFHECRIQFSDSTARMREAWGIAIPKPKKRKRGRRGRNSWLRDFGKQIEDGI